MKPVLQVALDLLNADRALAIAKDAVKGGADWLEAGTPLIKSEGMDIVRQLREQFPDKTIVADMKTMDTGALETEMAAKAGADIISILAASDDGTIRDASDISSQIRCETHDRSYQLTRYDTTGERGGKTRCPVPLHPYRHRRADAWKKTFIDPQGTRQTHHMYRSRLQVV